MKLSNTHIKSIENGNDKYVLDLPRRENTDLAISSVGYMTKFVLTRHIQPEIIIADVSDNYRNEIKLNNDKIKKNM